MLFWRLTYREPEGDHPKVKNSITNTGYFKQKAHTALQVKVNFKIHFIEALSYYNIWMAIITYMHRYLYGSKSSLLKYI